LQAPNPDNINARNVELQYPFVAFAEFLVHVKEVVMFFNNHHVINAELTELQQSANPKAPALTKQAETRWGSIRRMAINVLKSEAILHTMVTAREFFNEDDDKDLATSKQKVYEIIRNNDFIKNLKSVIGILEPIDVLICKYQSDKVPVSEVYKDFLDLPSIFQTEEMSELINVQQIFYIRALIAKRWNFLFADAHAVAYVLDPRFLGDGMPALDLQNTEQYIRTMPASSTEPITAVREDAIHDAYTKFQTICGRNRDQNNFDYKQLIAQPGFECPKTSVYQWWASNKGRQFGLLQKIALKVFSLVCSSASSERNFSKMGFIHSKLRNSLKQDKVEMLTYISTNAKLCTNADLSKQGSDSNEE
jgi:hypothetical protein